MEMGASANLRNQVLGESKAGPVLVSLPVDRIASIDWLRVLAAIGIVWFHTDGAPYRDVGYAGLPIFLLVFFSLITRQDSVDPTLSFLRRRAKRLLKPWLFWFLVYGAARLVKALHAMDVKELWEMVSVETVLAGTSIHLWYLPYAFLTGFLVYEANRRTARIHHVTIVLAATAVGVLTLVACGISMAKMDLINPFSQWEFGLAAIPLGFAVGRTLAIPDRGRQKVFLAAIALIVLLECLLLWFFGLRALVIPYGIAVMLVCVAYCWETRNNVVIATLAPLTFGVYLIHPLVAFALHCSFVPRREYALSILITVCLSGLITWVLMKTPMRRFLV